MCIRASPCGPLPAIGGPATKRASGTASAIGAFTDPTSVTTPLVVSRRRRTPSTTFDTGVATNDTSARPSMPRESMKPRLSASVSRSESSSLPETCHPRARNAAATEPPMRPRPSTFARFVTAFQRTARARTSWAVRCRHSPGPRVESVIGPMRVRTRRLTSCPTASHIRRTWR